MSGEERTLSEERREKKLNIFGMAEREGKRKRKKKREERGLR